MDDRDQSGYPDWMEDARYADEAPGRRHRRPGGYSGCGTVLPLLLATAVAADGRSGQATITITLAEGTPTMLMARPWSGVAPLAVRFSLAAS